MASQRTCTGTTSIKRNSTPWKEGGEGEEEGGEVVNAAEGAIKAGEDIEDIGGDGLAKKSGEDVERGAEGSPSVLKRIVKEESGFG